MSNWTTEFNGDANALDFDALTVMGVPGHPGKKHPDARLHDDMRSQFAAQHAQAKQTVEAALAPLSGDVTVRVTGSLSIPDDPTSVLMIVVEQR